MKRFIGLFAFLFVVALISGCDSAKDEDPTVTGVWSGTASVLGVSITITMNLLEDNQIVTETGTSRKHRGDLNRYTSVSRRVAYVDVNGVS